MKHSVIYMDHFKPEDFENDLEYKIGFTKRRFLKRGAVPSIRKVSSANKELHQKRAQRIEKRENKKIIEMLIQESDAGPVLRTDSSESPVRVEGTEDLVECQFKETDGLIQRQEQSLSSGPTKNDEGKEIDSFKAEIMCIRKENTELKKALKTQTAQLRELGEKRQREAKMYEYKMDALENCLKKTNFELSNLTEKLLGIFTKCQIVKLLVHNERSRKRKLKKIIN